MAVAGGWWRRGTARLRGALASTPGLLVAFFACLYTLTFQGRVNSFDGQSMFATTRALGDRLTLAVANPALGMQGRGGMYYSKYGIGQSLAELPLYLVGKVAGSFAGTKGPQVAELAALLVNPLLVVGCCGAAYGIFRALGFPLRTSVRATLVLGIATTLWPYSKSDFSEPLLALCVLLAVLGVLHAAAPGIAPRHRLRLDALAGLALAVAVLTKYAAVAYVPVFCLYLAVTLPAPRTRAWLADLAQRLAALLVPVLVAGCLVLLVNDLRFGSALATGYTAADHPLTTPLARGLFGLLLSPYRGVLFYDPLLFAGLLCLPLLVWLRPREALLPVGLLGISLLVYGTYVGWDAGPCWGTRYLFPVLPLLLWPLLALGAFGPAGAACASGRTVGWHLPRTPRRMLRLVLRGGFAALVAASVAVQVLGVSVNYYMQLIYWQVASVSDVALKSSLRASPLATAFWTLPVSLRFAFTQTLPATGYASANYPFGPPFPTAPQMPAALGSFFAQYFWFTLLPHPALACAGGVVLLGGGMVLTARALRRRLRLAEGDAATHPSAPLAETSAETSRGAPNVL